MAGVAPAYVQAVPVGNSMDTNYFSPCSAPNNVGQCCYAFWCTPCYTSQLKADLDGRSCEVIDCFCVGAGSLYMRRQLRAKYGLKQEIAPGSFMCNSEIYNQDVWNPCLFECCLSMPSLILGMIGSRATQAIGSSLDWLPSLAYVFHTLATSAEMRTRQGGAPFSYGVGGFTVPPGSTQYQYGLCDCCANGAGVCLYVFFCWPCALGHMKAKLQGRECDCCDCCDPTTPYAIRKTFKSKYGMEQDSCKDACTQCFCASCMEVQDYQEIMIRHMQDHSYIPTTMAAPAVVKMADVAM